MKLVRLSVPEDQRGCFIIDKRGWQDLMISAMFGQEC